MFCFSEGLHQDRRNLALLGYRTDKQCSAQIARQGLFRSVLQGIGLSSSLPRRSTKSLALLAMAYKKTRKRNESKGEARHDDERKGKTALCSHKGGLFPLAWTHIVLSRLSCCREIEDRYWNQRPPGIQIIRNHFKPLTKH